MLYPSLNKLYIINEKKHIKLPDRKYSISLNFILRPKKDNFSCHKIKNKI